MKKVLIFLAIIVVLFGGMAFLNYAQNADKLKDNPYRTNNLKQSTIDLIGDPLYDNIILPDDLEEKLANKEDVTVYFFSPECVHCQATTPIIDPMTEDMGIDLVKYNILEFEQGWDDYAIEATPTIIHFKDGEEYKRITGAQDEKVFKDFFTETVAAK
ncbi:MAG TPA: thioredoxin family protein [Bacillus sp. (in: firmicutes)]|nr:thioredoxin family protein [Bacillus sp. (in: firmicutes)]